MGRRRSRQRHIAKAAGPFRVASELPWSQEGQALPPTYQGTAPLAETANHDGNDAVHGDIAVCPRVSAVSEVIPYKGDMIRRN